MGLCLKKKTPRAGAEGIGPKLAALLALWPDREAQSSEMR
ncbi:hypothetical protein EPIB1_764 [Tritonibacter mobilis]|nr:hypothetical protein EPIB1_764 [Tritonibacter mobilis]